MVSTSDYSRAFDHGMDFLLRFVNEHCKTNFASGAELVMAFNDLQESALKSVEMKQVIEDLAVILEEHK